jgi:cadmium resistance protein CadD (predicted permease)
VQPAGPGRGPEDLEGSGTTAGAGDPVSPAVASGLTGVIGLTIANGGDNIAAYTPVFRALGAGDVALTVVVFAVGVAAWCLVGAWLVSHRRVTHVIQMWGHWIVPAVFILIGLYVFYKAYSAASPG